LGCIINYARDLAHGEAVSVDSIAGIEYYQFAADQETVYTQ
jgi:hypothetical protein